MWSVGVWREVRVGLQCMRVMCGVGGGGIEGRR